MSIAYLVSDYGAASHTFVRREVAALRSLGIAIAAFSVQPGREREAAESLLGRSVLDYPAALLWALLTRPRRFFSCWSLALRHRVGGLRALVWSQFHFLEALLLARLMRRQGVQHLHNHFANSGATVGMLAAHFAELPWSLTLHGISETDYPAGALLAEKVKRAAFVACASYFMRAQAMRFVTDDQWAKMHLVRCGIDLSAVPDRPAPHRSANVDPPRLVCVGRLSPEKGYPGLFAALAGLVEEGLDFSLTIVGDGPAADAIRADAKSRKLDDHIRFTGSLPESATLAEMAKADIFVLPSLMEGLPVVLVEALALGLPVVASRVAGIPELIEDDKSGRLFTPSDWQDLQARLRDVLIDRSAWARLGAEGRQRVEQEFRVETAAARMAELFSPAR